MSNRRKPTAQQEMASYAEQMRDQMANARENAMLVCVIDSDGIIAMTSPMGYGRRQVAEILTLLAEKVTRQCDEDGLPPLEEDQKPHEIPDDALRER